MKYSNIALQVLFAKESGFIRSNAQFWKNYVNIQDFQNVDLDSEEIAAFESQLFQEDSFDDEGFICAYDDNFPVINQNTTNSEKPYLLFYKGDISLLDDLNENVAVIGLINPTNEIERRETVIVRNIVEKGLVIVSGLAKGCDTIAHRVCIENNGKTIAILPSPISAIAPSENRILAENIVNCGGLLLTEYYKQPANKQEVIKRYIERDRLQAMFAKAVILIASYRKGEGDSGSRHAMEAARKFKIERYVMYNDVSDSNDVQFGLNKDLIQLKQDKIKFLNPYSIEDIKLLHNPALVKGFLGINSVQNQLF